MIFKLTKLNIVDSSGYLFCKPFHVYNKKGYIFANGFVHSSIKDTYLSLKHHIGRKKRMFILHSKKSLNSIDSTNIRFFSNDALPLKKRTSVLGKFTKGSIRYTYKRKKFITSFSKII